MKIKVVREFDFKTFFFQYGIRFLIAFAVDLLIFLIITLCNLFDSFFMSALNGAFISLCLMLFVAFFSFATNVGFFDIFAYSTIRFLSHIPFLNKDSNAFNGVYEYTKSKEERRSENKKNYLIYLIISSIYLILTIILYIIYRVNFN